MIVRYTLRNQMGSESPQIPKSCNCFNYLPPLNNFCPFVCNQQKSPPRPEYTNPQSNMARYHYTKFYSKLHSHSNPLIKKLSFADLIPRRLKIQWPRDLHNNINLNLSGGRAFLFLFLILYVIIKFVIRLTYYTVFTYSLSKYTMVEPFHNRKNILKKKKN